MNSHLFIVCSIIVLLPYLLWNLPFIKKNIPVVVIQMITGVLLGPVIFGRAAPSIYASLFEPSVIKQIDTIAQFSLIFLGLIIGLKVDTEIIKSKSYKKYFVIGVLSVVTPFVLALPVGYLLYQFIPTLSGQAASALTFTLSISLAASVTALPVLGALLVENGLIKRKEGKLAIVFASANDIVLWVLLVVIIGVTSAQYSATEFVKSIVLLLTFIAVLFIVVKPLIKKYVDSFFSQNEISNKHLATVVGLLFLSGAMAEAIGLQAILGTFLLGLILPRNAANKLLQKIEPFVLVILIPFFLTATGIKTNFGIQATDIWIIFIAITVVSVVGNFTGIALPAYFSGFSKRTSILLGIFMQCKGLMEIVVLTTFLNAKIISTSAFSGMLLMAIFTTALTQPLINFYLAKTRR
jgi:Kef-type K+ transport system membrane component KefB